jgi:hypothetical protein
MFFFLFFYLKRGKFPPFSAFFLLYGFFFHCVFFFSFVWKEEDVRRKRLKRKGRSRSQKWEGKAKAWK